MQGMVPACIRLRGSNFGATSSPASIEQALADLREKYRGTPKASPERSENATDDRHARSRAQAARLEGGPKRAMTPQHAAKKAPPGSRAGPSSNRAQAGDHRVATMLPGAACRPHLVDECEHLFQRAF